MKSITALNNSNGLTLLEVLVAISILTTTIVLSFGVIASINKQAKHSEVVSQILVSRTNLVNTIRNKVIWKSIVENNTSMECLKNFSDCRGLGGNPAGEFDIYLEDASKWYSSSTATQGFNLKGEVCNEFSNSGNGSPLCPTKLKLYWYPLCHPTETCIKPLVQIRGEFDIRTPQLAFNFNTSRINFDFIQSTQFCDEQVTPASLTAHDSGVALNLVGNSSLNSTSAASRPGGFAVIDQEITHCNSVRFGFKVDLLAPAADTENETYICFFAPTTADPLTSVCTYGFRHIFDGTKNTYRLENSGSTVFLYPNAINSSDSFEFQISNGIIKFYQNDSLRHIFSMPIVSKTKIKMKPAALSYSPLGINSIALYQDN